MVEFVSDFFGTVMLCMTVWFDGRSVFVVRGMGRVVVGRLRSGLDRIVEWFIVWVPKPSCAPRVAARY